MDSMMELVNALNALTAVLQKLTQQTTENYLNTFEELPTGDTDDAPVAESQPAPKPTVTIEQVRAVLSELSRAGKTVQVKELLKKHGRRSSDPCRRQSAVLNDLQSGRGYRQYSA